MPKYDVAIYLGTLPKIKNHDRKIRILNDFAEGARSCGARVIVTTDKIIQDARLAVMIGWHGMKVGGPHITFRKQLIDHQIKNGRHIMPIDGNCFKFADPDDHWLRYSLNSVFWNEGNYGNQYPSKERWRLMSKDLKIQCQDYTNSGDYILLCLQRDNGWQGKGFDQQSWVHRSIQEIRQHSQRPIVLRCHPGSVSDTSAFMKYPGVRLNDCKVTRIDQDVRKAWAGVFYNSSSSVACAIAGVPVFCAEPSAVTWEIANKDLSKIENPERPDRTQWLWSVADAHWSSQQSKAGDIYRHFEQFLSPA
jgi:hypothetical protein